MPDECCISPFSLWTPLYHEGGQNYKNWRSIDCPISNRVFAVAVVLDQELSMEEPGLFGTTLNFDWSCWAKGLLSNSIQSPFCDLQIEYREVKVSRAILPKIDSFSFESSACVPSRIACLPPSILCCQVNAETAECGRSSRRGKHAVF